MKGKEIILVGAVCNGGVAVLLRGDDANESSSEPPKDDEKVEVAPSYISSESSAPPMCRPLPSGKLMNVRDAVSDVSSESSCPPIKGLGQETNSEYLKKMGFLDSHGNVINAQILTSRDETKSVGDDIVSVNTWDTRHMMEQMVQSDDQENIDDAQNYQGDSLIIAAELRDAVAVQRILDLSGPGKESKSRFSLFNVFQRKMPNQVDVNLVDEHGKTALHIASEYGDDVIVKKLLARKNIDVNKTYMSGGKEICALRLACDGNHVEVFRLLLEHPDLDVTDVNFCLYKASVRQHVEIVKHLLQHPSINVNDSGVIDDHTALIAVCQAGSLEIVEVLLERSEIEVNKATIYDGQTPLSASCGNGHLEIAEKFLERSEIEVNKVTMKSVMQYEKLELYVQVI